MRYLLILIGVVCLALPACAPPPEPVPEAAPEPVFDQAAEEAAIRQLNEQEVTAYNNHDAKGMFADRAEDWESWDGTENRAAGEQRLTEYFEGRGKNIQLEDEEIGIIFVTPDVAIYKSRSVDTNELDDDGKLLPPSRYLYAAVHSKRNGKWLKVASFSQPIEEE